MAENVAELVLQFIKDRAFANKFLFAHRHTVADAPFHARMTQAMVCDEPFVLIKAFRHSAKSTTAEEVLITQALFNLCRFGLIIGNTYENACLRLATIKYELDNNELLSKLFGSTQGNRWGENVAVLANGVRLQAMGRGQSFRGAKDVEHNSRPDFVLVDDAEDDESVATPEGRRKTWRWLTRQLVPALDRTRPPRVRVLGTPLGEDTMVERLSNRSDWKTLTVPIYTLDDKAAMVPTWPALFPVVEIDKIRSSFEEDGDLAGFSQEYLCKPMDDVARTFKSESIQVVENSPLWSPKTLIVDPARTTNATSSRTGYVVGSWVGSELWVYEALGGFHKPSEQVDKIFELYDAYLPMTVAVEADGLEEWLMEPLRAQITVRGSALPLQPIRAPKDKKSFIAGLEPFFRAGEVKFVKPLADLKAELLSFPLGKLDVVNALAYMIRLRPGSPIYPGFTAAHMQHFTPNSRATLWLAMNATAGTLVTILVAVQDGCIRVLRDYVREGPLADTLRMIRLDVASLPREFGEPQLLVPQERTLSSDYSGLGNALRRAGTQYRTGRRLVESVECLTSLIGRSVAGKPALTVSPEATWTLNALAGGYCREPQHGSNILMMTPKDNIHKHVAQALECLVMSIDPDQATGRADVEYATTTEGRRYISMRRQ